ncbi:MAG: site-specific DNA-methyltransferase [Rhodocyclaceae bacterium UTPRO2]|jgi:adenine-specific DNA-methyltransferase|nr:MAG: site-specific DNA-methyltransferase [Rhodocyclaceae bacterium UTPRO2]
MPTLDWLHKQQAIKAAGRVPYRLLNAESVHGDPAADNWLIQGDNLEALKALLPFYAGRVKCIYIDPPYNTRSAFEHYDDNLEHSQWLSMMVPRLELLRELLAEDGSIWVSIDDNEAHYLKVVMDEVFGRGNFVTSVIWRKNYSPKSTARHFSEDHDYIVVYAKNGEKWVPNLMPRTEKQDKAYRNQDSDPRGPWKPGDLSARNFYSLGTYPIKTPSGRLIPGPPNAMYWRVSEEKLKELDADNRIWWGKDGSNVPAIKRFLSEVKQGMVPQTWWSYEEVGHTQDAKKEVVVLFGTDAFGTPKPEQLLQRILHIATNPGDLVLDSFLGSGTTAAVAHKMGRRWIGIEMGEHARTHCLPRLQKVIDGEQGGISQTVGWTGGGGFRFFTLGQPVFLADGGIDPGIRFDTLAAWVWYQETRTPWKVSAGGTAPLTPALSPQAGRGGEGAMPGTPLLGIHEGRAYALLYNGILGDRRPQGGNVLTAAVLAALKALRPEHAGPWMVFGESCRLSPRRLAAEGVRFRQIPYEIKAR